MRHRVKGRQLSRNAPHRLALFRNLSRSLITHESIRTTTPKARELRPFIERLITLAKRAAVMTKEIEGMADGPEKKKAQAAVLHLRRQAMAKLGPMAGTGIYDKKNDQITTPSENTVLKKLFNVLGPRYVDRPGGYTRIMKLSYRRLGDAGEVAVIELLKEGEEKVMVKAKKPAAAPAPVKV
jgi:large subunit ribosomal protein L17